MPQMQYLSQRDAKWASSTIGNTHLSIGRWGCTITALSMLSSYYGCFKSPLELAKIPGLFNNLGEIIWGKVESAFDSKIKFLVRIGSKSHFVRKDSDIKASIIGSPKTAVILQVGNGSHWVIGTGVVGNDFWCVDPWDGKKKKVLASYGNITGSAHFTN